MMNHLQTKIMKKMSSVKFAKNGNLQEQFIVLVAILVR